MRKLIVSFSGGRTSAYMLRWVLENWPGLYEIKVVFANTGKEHEGTFEFVRECAERFGCEITWVEAYPKSKKGWSVRAKVVDFDTAARHGEPFRAMIEKLGIPSANSPFCTYQLKRFAIMQWARDIGWKDYYLAIGIRDDEVDRVNPNHEKWRLLYPLITDIPTVKADIDKFWSQNDFDLKIPIGKGNCDNCWKKPFSMLIDNARRYPESYDWWREMETEFGYFMPRQSVKLKPPFHFYRGDKSVDDLFKMLRYSQAQLDLFAETERLDGCGESCEPF